MPDMRNEESRQNKIRNNVWIADSGASSHMTNDERGLINTRKIQSKVKIGSRDYVEAELIGDLRGAAKQKNGKETLITMINIKYVPQLFCNLISLTSILSKGFTLDGNEKGMAIKKANMEFMFDKCIKSGDRELADM